MSDRVPISYIDKLQRANADDLAFYPLTTLEKEMEDGHVILYAEDHDVATDVCEWAIANGDNPRLRIALCGYEGEHSMPESWAAVPWKAHGGYGLQGNGRGRDNAEREVVWFSPHCLQPDAVQPSLWDFAGAAV